MQSRKLNIGYSYLHTPVIFDIGIYPTSIRELTIYSTEIPNEIMIIYTFIESASHRPGRRVIPYYIQTTKANIKCPTSNTHYLTHLYR